MTTKYICDGLLMLGTMFTWVTQPNALERKRWEQMCVAPRCSPLPCCWRARNSRMHTHMHMAEMWFPKKSRTLVPTAGEDWSYCEQQRTGRKVKTDIQGGVSGTIGRGIVRRTISIRAGAAPQHPFWGWQGSHRERTYIPNTEPQPTHQDFFISRKEGP